MAKTVSGGEVSFEGKGCLATKMNITFFMGNEVLNIFPLTIFSKQATFLEKLWKKMFGGHDHFLEWVVLC